MPEKLEDDEKTKTINEDETGNFNDAEQGADGIDDYYRTDYKKSVTDSYYTGFSRIGLVYIFKRD